MDLRAFCAVASSSKSTTVSSDIEEDESLHSSSPKRQCTRPTTPARGTTQRKYNKKWEKDFPWLEYDENYQGAFCKVCRKSGSQGHTSQGSGGVWITKPFQNLKKAVQKMKAHASSESYIRHLEAELTAKKGGSIVHQLQRVGEQERTKNRNSIKSFLQCIHFLCKQHIPHTNNFDKLIKLVISCGGKDLDKFVRQAAKNTSYTSSDAVTDFLEALGLRVDESLVNRLLDTQHFSVMADECTNIATIEELSIFCRWEENGSPVEHFMEILPLKRCDTESVYSTLIE